MKSIYFSFNNNYDDISLEYERIIVSETSTYLEPVTFSRVNITPVSNDDYAYYSFDGQPGNVLKLDNTNMVNVNGNFYIDMGIDVTPYHDENDGAVTYSMLTIGTPDGAYIYYELLWVTSSPTVKSHYVFNVYDDNNGLTSSHTVWAEFRISLIKMGNVIALFKNGYVLEYKKTFDPITINQDTTIFLGGSPTRTNNFIGAFYKVSCGELDTAPIYDNINGDYDRLLHKITFISYEDSSNNLHDVGLNSASTVITGDMSPMNFYNNYLYVYEPKNATDTIGIKNIIPSSTDYTIAIAIAIAIGINDVTESSGVLLDCIGNESYGYSVEFENDTIFIRYLHTDGSQYISDPINIDEHDTFNECSINVGKHVTTLKYGSFFETSLDIGYFDVPVITDVVTIGSYMGKLNPYNGLILGMDVFDGFVDDISYYTDANKINDMPPILNILDNYTTTYNKTGDMGSAINNNIDIININDDTRYTKLGIDYDISELSSLYVFKEGHIDSKVDIYYKDIYLASIIEDNYLFLTRRLFNYKYVDTTTGRVYNVENYIPGKITVSVNGSNCDSPNQYIRLVRNDSGRVIGEYELDNNECVIDNLYVGVLYDAILIDRKTPGLEQMVRSRLKPEPYP